MAWGTLFAWFDFSSRLIVAAPSIMALILAGPTGVVGRLPAQRLWTSIDLIAVVLPGNFRVERRGITLAENGLDT